MIKDQDRLLSVMKECFSEDCREALCVLCRYMRKNTMYFDDYEQETFNDIEFLEDNLR
jgi:hypothetical protein